VWTRDVMRYLRRLHRVHHRPLVVLLDRLTVHRSAVRRLHGRGATWPDVEWLPANAPDLNPVEALWSHARYSTSANFVPDDVDHLYDAVIQAVGDVTSSLPCYSPSSTPLNYTCKRLRSRAGKRNTT
jgi:hypothetical protein